MGLLKHIKALTNEFRLANQEHQFNTEVSKLPKSVKNGLERMGWNINETVDIFPSHPPMPFVFTSVTDKNGVKVFDNPDLKAKFLADRDQLLSSGACPPDPTLRDVGKTMLQKLAP